MCSIFATAFLRPRIKDLQSTKRLAAFADAANWRITKRLGAAVLAACATVLSGLSAEAASFDCAGKNLSTVEKLICSDGKLSALDEALLRTYDLALASSPLPQTLKFAQREWIEGYRNESKTVAELASEYSKRIDALNKEITQDEAIRKQQPLKSELGKKCLLNLGALALAPTEAVESEGRKASCSLKYYGELQTPAGSYYYQVYRYTADDLPAQGFAIFKAGPSDRLAPVAWFGDDDTEFYEKPRAVSNPLGAFLDFPAVAPGTQNESKEFLFDAAEGKLTQVDATSWVQTLKLPGKYSIARGLFPDWKTMTAETRLWREKDADCCATGPKATISLTLKDNRVSVERLSIGK